MDTLDPAARRYAQAVLELALRDNSTPGWSAALTEMAAFMSRPDVKLALENTRVSQESKQELVDTGLRDLPALAFNLARLLVRKSRTNLIGDIAALFQELTEAQQGVARAHASTAVPLTDIERQGLVQRLQAMTGKRVLLETEVDPTLLGGVIVQIGDRLIDASTRARLEALRTSLVGAVG